MLPGTANPSYGPDHAQERRWHLIFGRRSTSSDEFSPRIGLQRSTWRTITFMSQFFLVLTGRSNSLHLRVGHGSTGSYSSGCPCSPVSLQRSQRRPCPVMGSGHQDPTNLMTGSSWPSHGSSCAITGTWCSGTSTSWGFVSSGKRVNSPPVQKKYFLSMELDLVNVMVHLTNEHAQSVLNCLSSFRGYSLTKAPLGTDALAHSWPLALRKYVFPTVSLLTQTLCKVREGKEHVLLVAPYWPTRTWFHKLMWIR